MICLSGRKGKYAVIQTDSVKTAALMTAASIPKGALAARFSVSKPTVCMLHLRTHTLLSKLKSSGTRAACSNFVKNTFIAASGTACAMKNVHKAPAA